MASQPSAAVQTIKSSTALRGTLASNPWVDAHCMLIGDVTIVNDPRGELTGLLRKQQYAYRKALSRKPLSGIH